MHINKWREIVSIITNTYDIDISRLCEVSIENFWKLMYVVPNTFGDVCK